MNTNAPLPTNPPLRHASGGSAPGKAAAAPGQVSGFAGQIEQALQAPGSGGSIGAGVAGEVKPGDVLGKAQDGEAKGGPAGASPPPAAPAVPPQPVASAQAGAALPAGAADPAMAKDVERGSPEAGQEDGHAAGEAGAVPVATLVAPLLSGTPQLPPAAAAAVPRPIQRDGTGVSEPPPSHGGVAEAVAGPSGDTHETLGVGTGLAPPPGPELQQAGSALTRPEEAGAQPGTEAAAEASGPAKAAPVRGKAESTAETQAGTGTGAGQRRAADQQPTPATPTLAPPDSAVPTHATATSANAAGLAAGAVAVLVLQGPVPQGPVPSAPTPAVAPPPRAEPPGPVQQLGAAFTSLPAAAPGAPQGLVIRLDPQELGRVQIKVEHGSTGQARVELAVERPDTLMLLMQDRPRLDQVLTQAGVPPEGRTLSFSLSDPGGPGNGSGGGAAGGGSGASGQGSQQDQRSYPGSSGDWAHGTPERERRAARAWARAGIDITA